MTLIEALVLGLVQGLTEFLPISSSGHLVIVPRLLGWTKPPVAFDVLLHSASLMAVLIYFRREATEVIQGLVRPGPPRRFIWLLVVGTIPAALIGYFLESQISQVFGEPTTVAILLIFTATILAASETYARYRKGKTSEDAIRPSVSELAQDLSLPKAFAVGCAQAFAILPGVSRSGSTIATGLFVGLSRTQAARFSFMLAIPILIGTSIYKIPDLSGSGIGAGAIIVGFVAGLISSYAAVAGMIGYLQKRGLYPFAVYCLVVGILLAVLWR